MTAGEAQGSARMTLRQVRGVHFQIVISMYTQNT
jgi:hypothetical protein